MKYDHYNYPQFRSVTKTSVMWKNNEYDISEAIEPVLRLKKMGRKKKIS